MLNRDVRARRQAPPQATLRPSLLRRYEAGYEDEGGARQSVDELGRDGLNSPCARIFVYQIRTASARIVLFFGTGEGVATRHVQRSGQIGLRR